MADLVNNCAQTNCYTMNTPYRWIDASPTSWEAETVFSISLSTQTWPTASPHSPCRLALLSSRAPCKLPIPWLTGPWVRDSQQCSTTKSMPMRLSVGVASRRALSHPPPPPPCRSSKIYTHVPVYLCHVDARPPPTARAQFDSPLCRRRLSPPPTFQIHLSALIASPSPSPLLQTDRVVPPSPSLSQTPSLSVEGLVGVQALLSRVFRRGTERGRSRG